LNAGILEGLLIIIRSNLVQDQTNVTADKTLDQWPTNTPGTIKSVDWDALGVSAARRLRAMGFDAGVMLTSLRKGGVIVVQVGRMTIAVRANQAAAFSIA